MIDEAKWYSYSDGVPRLIVEGLKRYVIGGIPTGSFLRAVLENDLFGAMAAADIYNQQAIHPICMLIWNCLPARNFGCWGSPEAVEGWIR